MKPQTILPSYEIYKMLKTDYNICQEHLSKLSSMVNDFNYGLLKMDTKVSINTKPKMVATWFAMFGIKVKQPDEIDNLLNNILEETHKEPEYYSKFVNFLKDLNPNDKQDKKDSDDADKYDLFRDMGLSDENTDPNF